ncbi:hypothetical protein NQ317_011804 [Molorchus minor]|uniref:Regulatory protein zeste n=1 Tax=Molorchus minor TaxID=1323400 RepID=A0ABQ9J6E5_9CUCU|nr:hypothetical protein NQ317_011804 [Molorchus minor]
MSGLLGKRRIRSANYSYEEKNLLLHIILKYKKIIESKKCDAVTWKQKEVAWNKIAHIFNTKSKSGVYRNAMSLKKAYDNMKRDTKNKTGDVKEFNINLKRDLDKKIIDIRTEYGFNNPYSGDQEFIDCGADKDIDEENTDDDNSEEKIKEENIILKVLEEEMLDEDWDDDLRSECQTGWLKNSSDCTIAPDSSQSQWSRRNGPMSALASAELSKKYNKLADLKIEFAQLELEKLKRESELRQKALELDIEIKKAYLKKIESSTDPSNFKPRSP